MPSKKAYDLVSDDGYDSRIPLHNEEAFQHGLQFQAKYIGTLDVPRPSSRVEIVAAMRRIRYEFKVKGIKKKKVVLTVSVEGVKVNLRKKKKSQFSLEETRLCLIQHPIYRIFYVSHDSQDLKIWSYIARDGPNNVFKCNVFKAYKKRQAMRIVRTIGQAFEVCHKLGDPSRPGSLFKDDLNEGTSENNEKKLPKNNDPGCLDKKELNTSPKTSEMAKSFQKPTPPNELNLKHTQNRTSVSSQGLSPRHGTLATLGDVTDNGVSSGQKSLLPLSQHHHLLLARQQLEQQQYQTQVAVAQVQLLKEQLSAETAARIEAQARTHQLILHNKDLLEHVSMLVALIQQLEMKVTGSNPQTMNQYNPPAQNPGATMPCSAPINLTDVRPANDYSEGIILGGANMFTNIIATGLDNDSPDSGHKEMSSDSLSFSLTGADGNAWLNPYSLTSFSCHQDSDLAENNRGWMTPATRCSLTSSSTSPSKVGALKSGSSQNVNYQGGSPSAYNAAGAPTADAYSPRHAAYHRSSPQNSPNKKTVCDKVKLISPLASPASSNNQRAGHKQSPSLNNVHSFISTSHSSLSVTSSPSLASTAGGATPKLDPPPKYRRTTKPIERWERGSWYGPSMSESSGSEFHPICSSRSNDGGIIMRSHSSSSNCSSTTTVGTFSDSSMQSSIHSNNRESVASLSSQQKQKLDLKINDLNSASLQHQQVLQQHQYQQQQQVAGGR